MPKKYKILDIAQYLKITTENIFNVLLDSNIILKKNRQMLSVEEISILLEKLDKNIQIKNLLDTLNHQNDIQKKTKLDPNIERISKVKIKNNLELNKLEDVNNINLEKQNKKSEKILNVSDYESINLNKNNINKTSNDNTIINRSPIVTIMGHVDHGKTSLLDTIRKSKLTKNEFGGITQHIGAYVITTNNGKTITFLDTPGHEAFTSMRSRGTKITDIVVLVVSIDDGLMPQTIEAINHAKEAKVPIIVAINKIDVLHNESNINNIIQQLASYDLVSEEWGGDTIICKISAKKNIGIDNLLDMIILLADMLELKANKNKLANGSIIEASLNKNKGPLATLLVKDGSLYVGNFIVTSNCYGKIKVMIDDNGKKINYAEPSQPVEILGLNDVPNAGDNFYVVEDEKKAKNLVKNNIITQKEEKNKNVNKITLNNLFEHINDTKMIELKIIIKADTKGSVEAIYNTLQQLIYDNVRIKVIHYAVGNINESDIMLAQTSNSLILGFNIQQNKNNSLIDKFKDVEIRHYNIIYDCIEDIKKTMQNLLFPTLKETILGHAEVRQIFKFNNNIVLGCYVVDGKINKNCYIRILRNNTTIIDKENILSLKRFKDDVKEVSSGYECGISLKKYGDIEIKDIIESYEIK